MPVIKIKTVDHGHMKTYHVLKDGKFVATWDYLRNAGQHKRDIENHAKGAKVLRPVAGPRDF